LAHRFCILEIKRLSSAAIVKLHRKLKLSQATFARVLNTGLSAVQKWGAGAKKPSGLALKFLNLADRKGLDGIL
jgi:putative transcriptional regulator